METYLSEVIRPFLTKPDMVSIERSLDDRGVLLIVTIAKEDMGAVIGHRGETANAIRQVIRSVGLMQGERTSVRFSDGLTNSRAVSGHI